ncbi:hypothetical protein [Rickettsia endosymbiont of Gonocerus acuteangulatus]|uniref:hypothetical protein n=1 Tax=Rickettsia endosymbiont of Gonocerus acuteangulatus TaxID=3066266 RepID=UPI003132DA36
MILSLCQYLNDLCYTIWYQWPTNPALNDAANSVKGKVSDFSCDALALVLGELGF